jgi:hypothetical protein
VTRGLTLAGYAVLAAAVTAYELAGRVWRRTPTLGRAVSWLSARRGGRWLLLAGWLWLGWHLFVRSGHA